MNNGDYGEQNRVKASFDAAYTALTPHQYLQNMATVDYQMADYMKPYLSAIVERSLASQEIVRVLDIGCSYGMSAALLKANCSYRDLVDFYGQEASLEYASCVTESRKWLDSHEMRKNVEVVGFDSSQEAVRFAVSSRMIDEGIAINLEKDNSELTADQRRLIQRCGVLLSTGAIGYVTDKTLNPVLDEFGQNILGPLGPVAVVSVLELFDPAPISEAFSKHGYRFEQLSIRMPQRRFVSDEERDGVLDRLQQRGTAVSAMASRHQMFANLCIAAKPQLFDAVAECVTNATDTFTQEVTS